MKRHGTVKPDINSMGEPLTPLEIDVGRQSEGCTYQLHPTSRVRIKQRYPELNLAPKLFVGYTTAAEFYKIHGPLWLSIAQILTGLKEKELREMGGIRIFDPVAEKEIWRYPSNKNHMVEARPAGKGIGHR
jgi:hypothetical protein